MKARVTDTNKAVQVLALDIVARIATGMGRPFEKYTRLYALPVSTVLSDQKTNIRQAGLTTLTAIAEACEGVESMAGGVATALESANPLQRSTLLNWIAGWFKDHEAGASLDLTSWAGPVVSCLDDRSADVRKGAQAVLPVIIGQTGFDYVMQQTNSLKPASRATVLPLIKAAAAIAPEKQGKPAAPTAPEKPSKQVPPPVKTTATSSASPPPVSPPPSSAPAGKLAGVRRKLPQGSISRPDSRASTNEEVAGPPSRLAKPGLGGLKRPGSTVPMRAAVASTPPPSVGTPAPFTTMNVNAKNARLTKDGTRWIVESGPVRKDLVDLLQMQVEPHASKELFSLLFSRDHNAVNDHVSGLTILCDFYAALAAGDDRYGLSPQERSDIGIANADLTLKYVSIRVHEPQPNLINKCLDTVEGVMAFFRDINYQLTDAEAICFIPTVVNKVHDPYDYSIHLHS